MRQVLLGLVVTGFMIYCLLDVLLRDSADTRGLPKVSWALIVLFFPVVGGIAWLVVSYGDRPRPARGSTWRMGRGFPEDERPLGPDDDPGWRPGPSR